MVLTYPKGCAGCFDGERAARDLKVWWQRVEREFGGGMIWTKELQERRAIHFNVLYYGHRTDWALLRWYWGEVIGAVESFQVYFSQCRSWKQALRYAGKYMGKRAEPAASGPASVAARDDVAGGAVGEGGDPLLDTEPYSTVGGRWWGVMGRENLPWGDLFKVVYCLGPWYYRFRRSARRYWRGVTKRGGCGFSLFTEHPEQWLALGAWFLGQECVCE